MTFEKLRLGLYVWNVQFESETFKIFFPGWLSVGNPRKVICLQGIFFFQKTFLSEFHNFYSLFKKNQTAALYL